MLLIDKLSFAYGDLKVLWDVDLEVKDGEIVTVVGANGAGKSTILKNVSRLVRPASGAIYLDGVELNRLASHQVVELGVVQVPEGRRIFPEMGVRDSDAARGAAGTGRATAAAGARLDGGSAGPSPAAGPEPR